MLQRNIHTYNIAEQLELHKAKAIVLGVGGGGCCMAEILARTGIGNITLVDFDTFEDSNKNRQIGALDSTIGKSKVEVMGRRLKDINPSCKITTVFDKISESNYKELLEDKDIILDAVDKAANKIMVCDFVKDLNKTYVSGGLGGYYNWTAILANKHVKRIVGMEDGGSVYPCASGVFMQASMEAQQGIDLYLGRGTKYHLDKIIKINQVTLAMSVEEII